MPNFTLYFRMKKTDIVPTEIDNLKKHLHQILGQAHLLEKDDEIAKPMASLVMRFSGKGLNHVGKAFDQALDLM